MVRLLGTVPAPSLVRGGVLVRGPRSSPTVTNVPVLVEVGALGEVADGTKVLVDP
jgi:hypothetical protein